MTTTTRPNTPRHGSGGDADYVAEIAQLVADLRKRDSDPEYASAPVLHAYARISKVHGAPDDEKPEAQMAGILQSFATRHARLGEVLMDHKRSAWKKDGKRPAWSMLLALLGKGVGQGVVCYHTDRLMRQPWDLETLIRVADQGGLVASLYGDRRLDDADDRCMLRVLVSFACKESDDKSRRIRDAAARRRSAGNPRNGAAPFGHRNAHEVSDEQLAVERSAVTWGAAALIRGKSLSHVAAEWNRRGLLTRRGKAWNALNVRSCLTLPRHGGVVAHEGKAIRMSANPDDVVLDAQTFQQLASVFEARKGGRNAGQFGHWASSILRCDGCGYPMVGSVMAGTYPDGERKRNYRCSPRGCANVAVDARAAESWLIEQTGHVLSRPDNARAIAERRSEHAKIHAEVAQLEAMIRDLSAKADGLHYTQRGRLDARIDSLEAQLTPLLVQRDALAELATPVAATLSVEMLGRELSEGGGEVCRQLAREAFPDGVYVAKVGHGRRLRGADIRRRFGVERHEATRRLAAE